MIRRSASRACASLQEGATLGRLSSKAYAVSTALFFALPYKGHIHPTLPVIEELVRRGERVLAYTTDEFRPMLGDVGAEFRLFPHTQSDTNALVTMVHWQLKVASNCMEQLVREARTSQAE